MAVWLGTCDKARDRGNVGLTCGGVLIPHQTSARCGGVKGYSLRQLILENRSIIFIPIFLESEYNARTLKEMAKSVFHIIDGIRNTFCNSIECSIGKIYRFISKETGTLCAQ